MCSSDLDSPWLSLGLEMALDPTTYLGAGAITKGAKGLGLVSKGMSAGKAVTRGAKALGKAALKPGSVIDGLAELPLKFKGRASQAVKGKAAQVQTAIASALGKGATAGEAVQVAAKADPAIDLSKHFGDVHVMPGAGESFVSHQLPAAADDISAVLGHGHPDLSPPISKYTSSANENQLNSLLETYGIQRSPNLPPAQANAFGQSPIVFDSTYAHGGGQFEAFNTLDQVMPPASMPTPSPVSAPGPTKSVAAPFKGGQFLSSAMDNTVYNPDLLRMLLGGMAINAAAHGRAQNPNSHAYMGMMQ